MEEKLDTDRTQEQLTWLENLQRNSWEPEVIISGITLAFLFIFPSKIYEFCVYLNQDVGIGPYFSSMLIVYLTGIVSVFKIFFVVHLCLRFIWTGLLGLSYAFPGGAINEKLFKVAQTYNYKKPSHMVLRMEKICSMTFALPISIVITLLFFTVYLGLLIAIYVWLDLNFFVIYLIFMSSMMLFAGSMLISAKSKFKLWYAQSFVSSINAIYQSNLGKWFTIGYSFFILILATPVIISDIEGFSLFINERNLTDYEKEWPAKNHHYQDQHDPEKRFPRAFISNEEISDNFLRIGIANYEDDGKVVKDLNSQFRVTLDTLGYEKVKNSADLHRIYLDDSLIKVDQWAKNRLALSSQKVYQAGLDISSLKNGIHTIRVEKLLLVYGFIDNKPDTRLRKDWSVFTFVKK